MLGVSISRPQFPGKADWVALSPGPLKPGFAPRSAKVADRVTSGNRERVRNEPLRRLSGPIEMPEPTIVLDILLTRVAVIHEGQIVGPPVQLAQYFEMMRLV
jgi:hypothetical protein